MPLWHCSAAFQKLKVQITIIDCIPSSFLNAWQGIAMSCLRTVLLAVTHAMHHQLLLIVFVLILRDIT